MTRTTISCWRRVILITYRWSRRVRSTSWCRRCGEPRTGRRPASGSSRHAAGTKPTCGKAGCRRHVSWTRRAPAIPSSSSAAATSGWPTPRPADGRHHRDVGDPVSGTVVRLGDRTPVGVLIEGGALEPVRRLLPPVSEAQQAELLARQCRLYNRRGIGVVRDPGLVPGEVAVYQAAADRGELTTRTRLMFWVMPQATVADTLAYVDSLPAPGSVAGDGGGLGIWGLKLGMDAGSRADLCEPYANDPGSAGTRSGELIIFEQVVEHVVGRGWRVGGHAVGDCAVRRVLDAYEQVALRHPGLPPGTRVMSTPSSPTCRLAPRGAGGVQSCPASAAELPRRQPGRYSGPGSRRPGHAGPGLVRRGGADHRGQRLQRQLLRPALPSGAWSPAARARGSPGPGHRVDTYTAIRLYTRQAASCFAELGSVGNLAPGASRMSWGSALTCWTARLTTCRRSSPR